MVDKLSKDSEKKRNRFSNLIRLNSISMKSWQISNSIECFKKLCKCFGNDQTSFGIAEICF